MKKMMWVSVVQLDVQARYLHRDGSPWFLRELQYFLFIGYCLIVKPGRSACGVIPVCGVKLIIICWPSQSVCAGAIDVV